jgi:hypothetical protein
MNRPSVQIRSSAPLYRNAREIPRAFPFDHAGRMAYCLLCNIPMRRTIQALCLADCGRRVKRKPAVYCSLRCQKEEQYRNFVQRWLNGQIDGTRAYDAPSSRIRRYLIETRGEHCEMCGWAERNPRTGRIPIHLDHIDGNARNNTPGNVRFLCPNHHSLTETFGNANKGNGRPGRRARYLKSQSADTTEPGGS